MAEHSVVVVAKVATVISDYEVALNVGSESGVEIGDVAVLFREVVVEDPDSGEELGVVSYPKLQLRVNLVQDRFCTARIIDSAATSFVSSLLVASGSTRKKIASSGVRATADSVYVEIGEPAEVRRSAV
ncbi:hypothetical protein [Microbacterium algeriense]|uniref:hypothetical protein n=1 Tax=Microbacterium algeriense TaxID=2615184 RepID=UPI003D762690